MTVHSAKQMQQRQLRVGKWGQVCSTVFRHPLDVVANVIHRARVLTEQYEAKLLVKGT